jgi:hypothetical protein
MLKAGAVVALDTTANLLKSFAGDDLEQIFVRLTGRAAA